MPQTVLTVFLSSTAKDLTAYRNAVHARLSKLEYFRVVWQEHFDAQDAQAYDYCRDCATTADIYVGLIGMRRGWEPKKDGTDRSITELEHDWAEEAGKPRLLYVAPETFSVPGNLWQTEAEHQRQLTFRQRMKSERIVSQTGFDTPELLATTIVERLLTYVIESDLTQLLRPDYNPQARQQAALETLPDAIAEKIASLLEVRADPSKAMRVGVEPRTIIELARRLKPEEALDLDQALKELDAAVQVAADVMKKGGQIGNYDAIVDSVRAKIAAKTAAGDLEGAAREADRGFEEWQRAETERRQTALQSGIAILEAGLEQDILRRDPQAAANRVQKIATLEHPDDADARFEAMRARQDEFYVRGRDRGINFDLEIAIAIAWLTLETGKNANQRSSAGNDLGNALATLGERESGSERLLESVAAYRAALLETTRERVPLDWATTQNNLGNALATLGARESGSERLLEAVEAYRAALLERTRERVPLNWAMTQNNLGNALRTLGARESGSERLLEAVEAYRAALLERTRERVPLQWATTQNNLGNALQTLGARESGSERLLEAVEAYRAALLERTRERVPLDWATIQNNLGNALRTLGERESGSERLLEAVAAYRAALLERTRERVPLDWATTQNNLGNALATLGARESGSERLLEAVAAYRAALLEGTRERVPLDWAMTQNNLGTALETLGARESGSERLLEAVAAYRAALEVFEDAKATHYIDGTRRNLARAETLLAKRSKAQ